MYLPHTPSQTNRPNSGSSAINGAKRLRVLSIALLLSLGASMATAQICGDGTLDVAGGETCDDANTVGGDGCSAICIIEPGYACVGEPSVCTAIQDCNANGISDDIDIATCMPDDSFCADCNSNGIPDECEPILNVRGLGEGSTNWFDTDAGNSLLEFDNFGVFDVGGVLALGTTSTESNIHSHYVNLDNATWSDYVYTGRMMVSDAGGGIGVTVLSDYPSTDTYYRLRSYVGVPSFHLSPHPDPGFTSGGTTDTGVTPAPNIWYRFKIEVEDTGTQTELRAKIWEDLTPEPAAWQIDSFDVRANRLLVGTVGIWSMGPGGKFWDDLVVRNLCRPSVCTVDNDCDDGNVCTTDTCDTLLGCLNDGTGVAIACDDGNACTTGDSCQGDAVGTCAGTDTSMFDCNDLIACTTDTCNPATGCVHAPDNTMCDDGKVCTTDTCDAVLGCVADGTAITLPCNDGNACTTADACQGDAAGTCFGTDTSATDCDDLIACTTDTCDPAAGCVHAPADSLCDDGNVCTIDTCDVALGCQTDGTGVTVSCDDGNACTTTDVCLGNAIGNCAGTNTSAIDCDDLIGCTTDTCDPLTGCDNAPTNSACDDGNACTVDTCDVVLGCQSDGTGVTVSCDDGNACTTLDACLGDALGSCAGTDTSAVDCDDGNVCTTDTCDAALGCQSDGTGVTALCDDGNVCTTADRCSGGNCVGGPLLDCTGAGDSCNTASCNPLGLAGNCDTLMPVANGTPCADASFCNGDEVCLAGVCEMGVAACADSCEQCNEVENACEWCAYDENRNGVTDGFDFAFLSGCFGACYTPGDACYYANYDRDNGGCVGGSDFGGLSGCLGLPCDECTSCYGPATAGATSANASLPVESTVRVVATQHLRDFDFADVPPVGRKFFRKELPLFLEIWATRSDISVNGDKGLASVYVNLKFDGSFLAVEETIHSTPFTTLAFDEVDPAGGHVRNLGGCAPLGEGTFGLYSSWVRVAVVRMRPTAFGATIASLWPATAPFGISLFNKLGDLGASQIELGATALVFVDSERPERPRKSVARRRLGE